MNSGRVDENGEECGYDGCRFNRPESRSDNFTVASPKLGVVYQKDNSTAFINFSHGFRVPQTTELYRLQRAQSVSEVEPEELIGIDSSWSTSKDNYFFSIEAYWYEKSNVILRDNDYYYVSNGETEHKGAEFRFETNLSEWLSLDANLTYSKHTYLNNPNLSNEDIIGNEILNAPNLMANISTRFQEEDWQVELNAQYIDEYYLNPENTSLYEGHVLLHLRSQMELSPALMLFLNVDNILNERYAERANYTNFTQERYFPGLPRNIKLSIKYEF